MEKQFVLLLAGLCLVQVSFAATGMEDSNQVKTSTSDQMQVSGPISALTPHIGGLSATFVGQDAGDVKSKSGGEIGVSIDIGRSNLVFETGLEYRQLNVTSGEDEFNTLDVKAEFDYLTLPLLAKYYFNGAGNSSPYFKLGLTPSLLTNAKFTSDLGDENINDTNSIVLGGSIGFGGNIKINPSNHVMVELVYSRDLTSAASDAKVYSSTIGLNVGFGFEL